jgi:hypothetical protein
VQNLSFARSCGLISGEWIAIDGSKFRAVASIASARERLALQRYLDSIDKADEKQQTNIDPSAVQAALEKRKQHPEPEAGFMFMRQNALPAYNVQTAVDTEHALIVAHAVVLDAADSRCLQPMAEAARMALSIDNFQRQLCSVDGTVYYSEWSTETRSVLAACVAGMVLASCATLTLPTAQKIGHPTVTLAAAACWPLLRWDIRSG